MAIDWNDPNLDPNTLIEQIKCDFIGKTNSQKVDVIDGFIIECCMSQSYGTGTNRHESPLLASLQALREMYDRKAGLEVGDLGSYAGRFRRARR